MCPTYLQIFNNKYVHLCATEKKMCESVHPSYIHMFFLCSPKIKILLHVILQRCTEHLQVHVKKKSEIFAAPNFVFQIWRR